MSQTSSVIASGAKWILIVNILQKIITFCLNQALIRWTSPDVLGRASIQFELLLSTLLFLSREGIRLAVLRENVLKDNDRQAIVNISWIPASLLSFIIAFQIINIVLNPQNEDVTIILCYCIGAYLESLGEPFFNVFQNSLEITARLRAETCAVFFKSLATFYFVGYAQMNVLGFGIAQIIYGSVYLTTLAFQLRSSKIRNEKDKQLTIIDFFPRRIKPASLMHTPIDTTTIKNDIDTTNTRFYFSLFHIPTLQVAYSMSLSSLLKHALTEADKIALTLTATSFDQGIYAVTNNYGSLIARTLFLPLEDSSRLVFSKATSELKSLVQTSGVEKNSSTQDNTTNTTSDTSNNTTINNTTKQHEEITTCLQNTRKVFIQLLRLVSIIGIFFPVFGTAYAQLLVRLVFNGKWQNIETARTLSFYCIYIFFLGINGVSEAFIQSIAPPNTLKTLSFGLILSTLVFVLSAIPCVFYFKTGGIVVANTLSMCTRIAFNLWFIHKAFVDMIVFFPLPDKDANTTTQETHKLLITQAKQSIKSPLIDLIPSLTCIVTIIISTIIAWCSAHYFSSSTDMSIKAMCIHVLIGGVTAVALLGLILGTFCPREDVKQFMGLVMNRKGGKGKTE